MAGSEAGKGGKGKEGRERAGKDGREGVRVGRKNGKGEETERGEWEGERWPEQVDQLSVYVFSHK